MTLSPGGEDKGQSGLQASVASNEADVKQTSQRDAVFEKTSCQRTDHQGVSIYQEASFFQVVFDDVLINPAVLEHAYQGSGTEENPFVCEFIPNDPRNPQNWSSFRKWNITAVAALATFAIAFNSSAYSAAISEIIVEFECSPEVAVLGLSLFVLGYVVGPLMWGPMSELYGRRWLFIGTYMALTAFSAGCAGVNSVAALIVLRFLAGTFGSSPLTNSGGIIADMFDAKIRGLATAFFSAAPFLGPSLGPVVGGFVGEAGGWRWVMGILAILAGLFWIMGILALPETYAPRILEKRARRLSKMTGKVYRTRLELAGKRPTPAQAFKIALSRPWVLLFREPIVLVISIYSAIIYGTLYMLFGAFPIVYQQYRGWSAGIGGLAFLGVLVGMLLACAYTFWDNSKRYVRTVQAAQARGERGAPPGARLPPAIVGSIALPIGLFWFAWTNNPHIHWIVSIIGSAPFGFGMVLVFLACTNYLVDTYTIYAASVLAANSVLRSLFGAVFPLFTDQMYRALGIHWASSIPAFLALLCLPAPLLFYKYDAPLRRRCKYAHEAEVILNQLMVGREQQQKKAEAAKKMGRQVSDDEPSEKGSGRSIKG